MLAIARQIEHAEQEILKRIAKRQTLREARARLPYHALQTPPDAKP